MVYREEDWVNNENKEDRDFDEWNLEVQSSLHEKIKKDQDRSYFEPGP